MMSLHKISAGDGYAYYTNEVSRNDEVREHGEVLTDYYLETGNPPGEWIGQGAANLDLDGEVTEEQMQHLFGEGVHPDADNIVRREIRSGSSKRMLSRPSSLDERITHSRTTKPNLVRIWPLKSDHQSPLPRPI